MRSGAVTGASADEVGVANSYTIPDVPDSGTDAPGLAAVELQRTTDAAGDPDGVRAVYAFTEDVASLGPPADFHLYLPDGTDLNPDGPCRIGNAPRRLPGDANVVCTFTGAAPATADEALHATLATVGPGAAADGQGHTSLAGEVFTTGGTGTPAR